MRNPRINQKEIYYATYSESVPVYETDEDGNIIYVDGIPVETGEYTTGRGNPVKAKMSVSASKGEANSQPFGTDVAYTKVLCTCDMNLPIDENTVLWVDIAPTLKENGSTDSKHDYKVVRVAKGLHNVLYAIEKV